MYFISIYLILKGQKIAHCLHNYVACKRCTSQVGLPYYKLMLFTWCEGIATRLNNAYHVTYNTLNVFDDTLYARNLHK